jgi:hypothetical protein
MRDDIYRFLSVHGRLPERVNVEQTSWLLNCQPHNIPVLVAARLLKPLGNPQPNSVKYFATNDIIELSKDKAWLGRMTNVIYKDWQARNARYRTVSSETLENVGSEIAA